MFSRYFKFREGMVSGHILDIDGGYIKCDTNNQYINVDNDYYYPREELIEKIQSLTNQLLTNLKDTSLICDAIKVFTKVIRCTDNEGATVSYE